MSITQRNKQQQISPPTESHLAFPWARLALRVAMFAVLATPLVFFPTKTMLYNAPETSRRLVLLFGVGLLLASVVYDVLVMRGFTWRKHKFDWAVGMYFLAALIASGFAAYPSLSFTAPLWAQDSLGLLALGGLLYIGVRYVIRSIADVETMTFAIVLVGGAVALIGLLDFLFQWNINPAFSGHRLYGSMQNPMYAGTYLAVLIPLGAGLAISSTSLLRRRILHVILPVLLICLILTQARAAWIGGLCAGIMVIILMLWHQRIRMATMLRATVLVAVAFGVLATLIGLTIPEVRTRYANVVNLEDATVQTRLVYMQGAVNLFMARPVTGWGPGHFRLVFPQYRPMSTAQEMGIPINRGYVTALPHCLPLQIAAETGVLGVLAFLFLLILVGMTGLRLLHTSQSPGLLVGVLGGMTAYLISNLFAYDNAATLALFWLLLAMLASLECRVLQPTLPLRTLRITPTRRVVGKSISVAIAVIAVVYAGSEFLSAYYTQQGLQLTFNHIRKMQTSQLKALVFTDNVIAHFKQAKRSSITSYYLNEEFLSMAYRERMELAKALSDHDEEKATRTAMFRHGEKSLALLDRSPTALRFMAIEYINAGNMDDAWRTIQQLLRFEPYSAEVRLIAAEYYGRKQDVAQTRQAALTALSLDPDYAEGYSALARSYSLELDAVFIEWAKDRKWRSNPAVAALPQSDLIEQMYVNYQQAAQSGLQLANPYDRIAYVTALILKGHSDDAIKEGKKLRGRYGFDFLCKRIIFLTEGVLHDPMEGQRIIAAMNKS